MDGPRDQLLARAALAGDQHREVVALQALNLVDDAVHRGAGADESGQQRLERPLADASTAAAIGRSRAPHRSKPCRATAAIMRTRRITVCPSGRAEATPRRAGRRLAADVLRRSSAPGAVGGAVSRPAARRCGRRPRRCPRARSTRTSPPGSSTKTTVMSAPTASSIAAVSSRASRSGSTAASTSRSHQRVVGVGGGADVLAGARPALGRCIAACTSSRSRVAPSDWKTCAACWKCRSAVDRAPALRGQAAERELADGRPDSVRRPARRRSSSARCRGRPRSCATAAPAGRRAAAGTRPRRRASCGDRAGSRPASGDARPPRCARRTAAPRWR